MHLIVQNLEVKIYAV